MHTVGVEFSNGDAPGASFDTELHGLGRVVARMPSITRSDRARVQTHLRTLLNNSAIVVDPAETQGGTAVDFIGTARTIAEMVGRVTTEAGCS